MPKFKGLIFDFNGVLLWDNDLHEEAWRRYSTHLRGYPLRDDEMHDHVHGRVNADIFAYLLGRYVAGEELLALAEQKECIYRELCLAAGERFQLSPGTIDLFEDLRAQDVPYAIATSSAEPNVRFYIEHLCLDRWFTPDRIIYDLGRYPGKPAPDIYLEAAGRLGLKPGQCVVVEDSLAGIQAAAAAGIGWIVGLGLPARQAALRDMASVREVISALTEFRLSLVAG